MTSNRRLTLESWLLLSPLLASAQLAVTVSPVKIAGQKAIVPLSMKNNFTENIESARTVCFLLDDKGNVVAQATRWIIGGNRDKPGLPVGATNVFNFVVSTDKPLSTTNLTARISFSRVILEGGKPVDPARQVKVTAATR